MKELKEKFEQLRKRFFLVANKIDKAKLEKDAFELEQETLRSDFWADVNQAQQVMQKIGEKRNRLEQIRLLSENLEVISGLLELSAEELKNLDVEKEINTFSASLEKIETELFLSGKYDSGGCLLSIHAGQGGVEAMDWAVMLLRMYLRFCEKKGWSASLIDETKGEEAGIKSAVVEIADSYAYGYLKAESGTHRLVRQSPFNADNLRQTSFALVEVLPLITDPKEIEIDEKDIEIETFRSSGPGGQNVQKVSTAVRVKHKPTRITVSTQSERSQYQNRENALKILKAKLFQKQLEQRRKTEESLKGWEKTASWGTQIRSYVLHPYKLVKDLRTGYEVTDTESVLNGEIEGFLESEIKL